MIGIHASERRCHLNSICYDAIHRGKQRVEKQNIQSIKDAAICLRYIHIGTRGKKWSRGDSNVESADEFMDSFCPAWKTGGNSVHIRLLVGRI